MKNQLYYDKYKIGYTFPNTNWTVINEERIPNKHGHYTILVECICGTKVRKPITKLVHNKSISCKFCSKSRPKEILPIGSIYGNRTITSGPIYKNNGKRNSVYYTCKCSCGRETPLCRYDQLVNNKVASCGKCKTYKGVSGAVIRRYIIDAKRRKLDCDVNVINSKYINDLLESQRGLCALSGVSIHFEPTKKLTSTQTASIDRINSNLGYIVGNIQIVHKRINLMKGVMSDHELVEWAEKIINTANKKII